MRKEIHCPLTRLPIPVIVGNENEMLCFMRKQKHLDPIETEGLLKRLECCDGMVAETKYKGYDTWVVFLRKDDKSKGVTYNVAVHETFHLWGSLTSYMYGNDVVQYHIDSDEQCAYHFGKLFTDLTNVVAEADKRFQKEAKLNESIHKQLEQNKIESEEIPFISIDGTDKTAEEIIAELRNKNT